VAGRRFDGRREVAIGLGVYAAYLLVRQAKLRLQGRAKAERNAERVVAFERRLGIHVEPAAQGLLLHRRRLLGVLNVAYVTLNVVLTIGWLILLFRRRDPDFQRFRRAAALATLGAQPVFFFFPVAPPRSLDHMTDTLRDVSGFDIDKGLVAEVYDPLAAFPSIHLAFAVVTAAGLGAAARSPWVRGGAPLYPPVVAGIVVVTGNHYVVDAVGGWALGRLALRLAGAA
jgi:membrane-associated phospholipid phosphatase